MASTARIMAVIHHRDEHTTLANAAIAATAGCDGVFLIQMEGRDELIDGPAVRVKAMFPELLVGTNRLSTHPLDAISRDVQLGLDATWCDDPGVRSSGMSPLATEISSKVRQVQAVRPDYLYFGSVAFKTQEHDDDPAAAALIAHQAGFIATTSGPQTGTAPSIEKLRVMSSALGTRPLAVASGVSPDNVDAISPFVTWILVATGVSKTFHEFDPEKLQDLVSKTSFLRDDA